MLQSSVYVKINSITGKIRYEIVTIILRGLKPGNIICWWVINKGEGSKQYGGNTDVSIL